MKIIADSEHIRFFRERRYIQFDEVISQIRLDEVNRAIDALLSSRTGAKPELLPSFPPAEIYPYACDLWKESEIIKKFDCQSRCADLILSLFDAQKFILGSDQLLVPEHAKTMGYVPYYSQVFPEPLALEEQGSIQGVHSALIVCLSGESKGIKSVFPTHPGSVTVLSPEYVLDLGELENNLTQRFLLITYAKPDAVYLYREGDPNTHYRKSLGYTFGDKLLKKGHPPIRL